MVEEIEIDFSKISQEVLDTDPLITSGGQTQEQLMFMLGKEIKEITKDVDFFDERGKKCDLNIFYQLTPFHEEEYEAEDEEDEEESKSDFPYCQIKFDTSEENVQPGTMTVREQVKIILGFAIYYEHKDRQYQHTFFQIYNRIKLRFIKKNILNNFRCVDKIRLALNPQDEETYPYYYAAVSMTWEIPGIDRGMDEFS